MFFTLQTQQCVALPVVVVLGKWEPVRLVVELLRQSQTKPLGLIGSSSPSEALFSRARARERCWSFDQSRLSWRILVSFQVPHVKSFYATVVAVICLSRFVWEPLVVSEPAKDDLSRDISEEFRREGELPDCCRSTWCVEMSVGSFYYRYVIRRWS